MEKKKKEKKQKGFKARVHVYLDSSKLASWYSISNTLHTKAITTPGRDFSWKQKPRQCVRADVSRSLSVALLGAQSCLSRYLLQCVGRVEDGGAGTAGSRG